MLGPMNITTEHVRLMRAGGIDIGQVARAMEAMKWPNSEWSDLDHAAVDYYHAVKQDIQDILRPTPAKPCCAAKAELLNRAAAIINELDEHLSQAGVDARSVRAIMATRTAGVDLLREIAQELGDG